MTDLRLAATRALEALENLDGIDTESECVTIDVADEIAALRAALAQPDVPEGFVLVVSGAIFDFAGYLTTRTKVIEVGAAANASPIADLVKEWAKLRGLSLDDPAVLSWQEWLPKDPKGGA